MGIYMVGAADQTRIPVGVDVIDVRVLHIGMPAEVRMAGGPEVVGMFVRMSIDVRRSGVGVRVDMAGVGVVVVDDVRVITMIVRAGGVLITAIGVIPMAAVEVIRIVAVEVIVMTIVPVLMVPVVGVAVIRVGNVVVIPMRKIGVGVVLVTGVRMINVLPVNPCVRTLRRYDRGAPCPGDPYSRSYRCDPCGSWYRGGRCARRRCDP